jgi:hypothetical protein
MKEKPERHEHSRDPARERTGAAQLTHIVQIGLALIAHGVHNPPWLSALLGDGGLQVSYRIYNVQPGVLSSTKYWMRRGERAVESAQGMTNQTTHSTRPGYNSSKLTRFPIEGEGSERITPC